MKRRTLNSLAVGLTATFASFLAVSVIGGQIANSYRANIDSALGTKSYVTVEGEGRFNKKFTTIDQMINAARAVSVKEGQEGTVLMKNDNAVLPLAAKSKVALFGIGAYATFPYLAGDLKAGNADAIDLETAFTNAGFTLEENVASVYKTVTNKHKSTSTNPWTGETVETIAYDAAPATSPGDMVQFQNNEIPASALAAKAGVAENWVDNIDNKVTAFVVITRGAGEGNTYDPVKLAKDYLGNDTTKVALALSDDELSIIDLAKSKCSKVVVLINSGNNLELGEISKGGAHEVDGIAYIGCINDYQLEGVVDVLSGKVNASGHLSDTFVVDNLKSIPASQNIGSGIFTDASIVEANATNGYDPRWPNTEIQTGVHSSFASQTSYSSDSYIVEAEGIYVGYKYFETRYYDSIANPSFKADAKAGSHDGNAWSYDKEVLYTFGSGLSYLDYTQNITNVYVDKTNEGDVTATVAIKNNGDKEGLFAAQLYVQQPYTQYDRTNLVEKSAVMFLNSAKVLVPAGQTKEVTITVPTKYLASYDSKAAKTYILDEGDYLFTAANGAHEAVNNFLKAQGHTPTSGEAAGAVTKWNSVSLDTFTYAVSYNNAVTNQVDNADLNYWLPGKVEYMTRQNWETFPKNYNDVSLKIAESAKKDEWLKEFRGQQYTIKTNNPATEGADKGLKFGTDANLTYDQLSNINDQYWSDLVSEITIDEAVGAVIHGGSQTDKLTNVENPIVAQNEGVSGFTTGYTFTDADKASSTWCKAHPDAANYKFNVHSQTLIATSFNPDLAYEWGEVEGNSGLWVSRFDLWGTGLTQRRTPYNGRNYEYISEDSMLANRLGAKILRGCADYGIINGPKHLGANDQEYKRAGLNEFMTEQKLREGDLRCFQAALEPKDGGGLAVMIAFNRIGSTNACHSVGVIKNILRGEWGFNGIISTDMATNPYYFIAEAMVMSTITQVADFAQNDNHINANDGVDKTWGYISVNSVKNDKEFVEQARQDLKYQLFTFANSYIFNVKTTKVTPAWETAINTVKVISIILTSICAIGAVALLFVPGKKKEVA